MVLCPFLCYTIFENLTHNARYNSKFVEVKVRMTPERRTVVQEHASSMEESTTAFINRAIDETMARDQEKKSSS